MGARWAWPRLVKLLGRRVDIQYVDQVSPETDTDEEWDVGCCESTKSLISIHRDQDAQSMGDTLVHELAHYIFRYEERCVLFATMVFHLAADALGMALPWQSEQNGKSVGPRTPQSSGGMPGTVRARTEPGHAAAVEGPGGQGNEGGGAGDG